MRSGRAGGRSGGPRAWLARIAAALRGGRPPPVDAGGRTAPAIGRWGEGIAARHLRRKGYRILRRNLRVGRRGEIDLVVRRGDTLVFVEVRTRATEAFGRPAETVGPAKRRTLSRAATGFLRRLRTPPDYIRFDIVEVIGRAADPGAPEVRHIESAFPLEAPYRYPV